MITEAEEQDRDRDAATAAYRTALAMAELEYASLEAAVQRSNILKSYIRIACRLLGRDLDDKYKTPQEMGAIFHMGGGGGIRYGNRNTNPGKQPQGQGVESASRGTSQPKQG